MEFRESILRACKICGVDMYIFLNHEMCILGVVLWLQKCDELRIVRIVDEWCIGWNGDCVFYTDCCQSEAVQPVCVERSQSLLLLARTVCMLFTTVSAGRKTLMSRPAERLVRMYVIKS